MMYEPDRQQLPDGSWMEIHKDQERQSDAQAAIAAITDLDAATVLWIMDGDRAVARVYATGRDDHLRYVIRLTPARRVTQELADINRELGREGDERIRHAGEAVADPLDASEDRALEVSTRQGVVELDRRKVLERIAFGQDTAALSEVRHT